MIRNEPSFMVRSAFSEFAKSCHATCPNRAWPAAVGRVPTLSQANTAPEGFGKRCLRHPVAVGHPYHGHQTWRAAGISPPERNGGLELGATSYIYIQGIMFHQTVLD